MSSQQQIMVVTSAPPESVARILDAISAAGGGIVGKYTHCAFTNPGSGHFKPEEEADPHVGVVGEVNAVPEIRIETFCTRAAARAVAAAIREAHPYEEPVIYLIPLLSVDDL
jgi:hypothetical protein